MVFLIVFYLYTEETVLSTLIFGVSQKSSLAAWSSSAYTVQ